MILDTDFIIDVMHNDTKALAKLHEMINKGEPQGVGTPTIFELHSGLVRSQKPQEEKQKITRTLEGISIFHLDRDASERAGEIDGSLIKKGIPIQPTDSMIAGIALTQGEAVLTRNTQHFLRVLGLKVETY